MDKLYKILITGGAGFIGSNLVDHFINKGHHIIVLDNLSTGFEKNIAHHFANPLFKFINGDIRDLETCMNAAQNCDYIFHQAALGSVPRSIKDPITTNAVNVDGFVNMLVAARENNVKRFIYAASSSTYGDSKKLPKIEELIGKPLSPYAVTKYVNELYADVFAKTYGMQCIGLRYFNVFGRRQDPNGAYAAVIPLWSKQLINHTSPTINGDGTYSRDFTYIDNVLQANEKAMLISDQQFLKGQYEYYNIDLENHKYFSTKKTSNKSTKQSDININENINFSEVFNVAFGDNTNLLQLFEALRDNLAKHDPAIKNLEPVFGQVRPGDIPHSQASVKKAEMILGYKAQYNARQGFERVAEWYFKNL